MTAVKDNQPTLLDDLRAIDREHRAVRATEYRTVDKAHGRIETRTCRVVDLGAEPWNDRLALPHRRQAFRIERTRQHCRSGHTQHETVHGLTSVPREQASAEHLLRLVRGHWSIENRLHRVRDTSCDEDRCRVHVRHLPRHLACLTNCQAGTVPANRW